MLVVLTTFIFAANYSLNSNDTYFSFIFYRINKSILFVTVFLELLKLLMLSKFEKK